MYGTGVISALKVGNLISFPVQLFAPLVSESGSLYVRLYARRRHQISIRRYVYTYSKEFYLYELRIESSVNECVNQLKICPASMVGHLKDMDKKFIAELLFRIWYRLYLLG